MIVIPYDPILFDAYCEAMQLSKYDKECKLKQHRTKGIPKCNSERMLIGKLYLENKELKSDLEAFKRMNKINHCV